MDLVQRHLAFPGDKIEFVDDYIAVYIHGNGLTTFDISTSETKQLLINPLRHPLGISALATNADKNIIAFAPRSTKPDIHVLTYPELGNHFVLERGTDVEYANLAISHGAEMLCAISGPFDPHLYLWSLQSTEIISSMQIDPGGTSSVWRFCSFSPGDISTICTAGGSGLVFWKAEMVGGCTLKRLAMAMLEDQVHDGGDGRSTEQNNAISAACWAHDDLVIAVSRKHRVMKFKPSSSENVAQSFHLTQLRTNFPCIFLALVADKMLLAFSNGSILRLSADQPDLVETVIDPNNDIEEMYSSCVLLPSQDKLLLSGPGVVASLPVMEALERSNDSPLKVEPLLIDCHKGSVVAMITQSTTNCDQANPCLITAGADGALKVWNRKGTVLAKHVFWEKTKSAGKSVSPAGSKNPAVTITSMTATPSNFLFAAGTSTGSVFLLCLLEAKLASDSDSIELCSLGSLRLSHESITHTLFRQQGDVLAVTCESDIYVLDTTPSEDGSLAVLAQASFGKNATILCSLWCDNLLLVSFADQTIDALRLGDERCSKTNLFSLKSAWTCDVIFPLVDFRGLDAKNYAFWAISPVSCQILEFKPSSMDSKDNIAYSQIESSHEKGIMSLGISNCGNYLATGGMDGRIILWKIQFNSGAHLVEVSRISLHVGSVDSVCFFSGLLYSCGSDGGMFGLKTPIEETSAASHGSNKHTKLKSRPMPIPLMSASQVTWNQKHNKQVTESSLLESETKKALEHNRIAELRHRLQELLVKNNSAPSIEKLGRDEFVVDINSRDKILAINRKRAKELEQNLIEESRARSCVSDRIKRHCWDSMEVQSTECHAFQRSNVTVSNFPLKRRSSDESRRLRCIRSLRKLDLREMASSDVLKTRWSTRSPTCPQDISWIVNQGELRPTVNIAAKDGGANGISQPESAPGTQDEKDEDGEVKITEHSELDIESLTTQVYEALALRTSIQKRNQQILIHELVRSVQIDFNDRFNVVYDDKRNEFDRICEKNERIGEILSELSVNEDFFKPAFVTPQEIPETVLEITDSEIQMDATDMQSTIKDQVAGACDHESGQASKNASKRALDDMMYGALESKKEVDRLRAEIRAPSWMNDTDNHELSDAQRRELEEYEAAKKAFEERQIKYRKAMELEFKKLRTEVGEVARSFDEKAKRLARRRVHVMTFIITQELSLIRTCISLLESENNCLIHGQLGTQISALDIEKGKFVNIVKNNTASIETAAERLEKLQLEDKAFERNFKRDMQAEKQLDQQDFKTVLNYYRDRSGTAAGISEKPEELSRLDDATWRVIRSWREQKLQKEAELKEASDVMNHLKCTQTSVLTILAQTEAKISDLWDKQSLLIKRLNQSEQNLEILVKITQAQDELEEEAVVTEYSDAVLVPVDSINVINNKIYQLGHEQVKSLNKIKHFRKSINFMEWENSFLKEQAHNLEEYYTDLQLLHVTKSLQSVMKNGQGITPGEQMHKAEDRIRIMNRVHKKNSSKLNSNNRKVALQIRSRMDENERLKQQLSELKEAVKVREAIARSRVDSSSRELDPGQSNVNRMKRITLRRRLIDLARLQTEEIDFLRQELDRLRQRTFPSFAHATRDRLLGQA